VGDSPLRLKKTTDYISANTWLNDEPNENRDGFELGAMLIHRLIKDCLGGKEIPGMGLCIRASEQRLSVIDKIALDSSEVHAALAKHYLQKALKDYTGGVSDFSVLSLVVAGIRIGQSFDVSNDMLSKFIVKECEIRRKCSEAGKRHHAEDRNAFKNDYRAERDDEPSNVKSRPAIVADLMEHYPKIVYSTLQKWAKEADKEDGFIRRGGRPKKGE